MMYCFWKKASKAELMLIGALEDAHVQSTQRENLSTQAILACACSGVGYTEAIAAALLTLGGTHAPIKQAIFTITHPETEAEIPGVVKDGGRIAGWGNSFVKGKPDPIWNEVYDILSSDFPGIITRIASITSALHAAGANVFPNPACYTAATAIVTGMPEAVAAYLFVGSRLGAWTELYAKAKA